MDKKLTPQLQDDIYYFNTGSHHSAYQFLGAHFGELDGQKGVQFNVWAPNAGALFLQGDFTDWNYQEMTLKEGGVWTTFVPGAKDGQNYKIVVDNGKGSRQEKIDPFGFRFERPPKGATVLYNFPKMKWEDKKWMNNRKKGNWHEKPITIYEVHASSWKSHEDGTPYTLADLKETLIPYVKKMGYTHIEFLPLMQHPLDASWGYQITGFYALNHKYGTNQDLKDFVNEAHKQGIGIIMDWVPGHFNRNADSLSYYDGTPTFEYQDYNRANNENWGTLNFDLGKSQVRSFLLSNALYWLKEYHIDGLRVDAVTNMLYLDFDTSTWTPNEYGNNMNIQGIDFLREFNEVVHQEVPGALTFAEESSDYHWVTRPVEGGDLGFDFKWNMGWMHDSLKFFSLNPWARTDHLNLMTFVYVYQYNENYVLPYSHDEVVHGKHSLLGRIPGEREQQFQTLRLLEGYMAAQPGKTLNFMGNEFGQYIEWRYNESLDWDNLNLPYNKEYQHFISTLNHFVQKEKALYELDHDPKGLHISNVDDIEKGTYSFVRFAKDHKDFVVVAMEVTPQQAEIRLGVPELGQYQVVLNSALKEFGGRWTKEHDLIEAEEIPAGNLPYSISIIVPDLSILFLKKVKNLNKKSNSVELRKEEE